ncbi:MAG TPA: hypothetical protein VF944_10570 [Candidatus Bathyarchaeia archaeon]
MEPGERCICQENDWHNAYGDSDYSVHRGMRLTVVNTKLISGTRFYAFEETPKDHYYLHLGFKPLRSLN